MLTKDARPLFGSPQKALSAQDFLWYLLEWYCRKFRDSGSGRKLERYSPEGGSGACFSGIDHMHLRFHQGLEITAISRQSDGDIVLTAFRSGRD